MIDFASLAGKAKESPDFDLLKLYASLDVKSTHTEPRTTQKEAMLSLTARHSEKDLVLKISTGAGKTGVGLLYLVGHMRKTRRPGVYLCPTLQLVEQVLSEASKLGIDAHHYPSGEPFPHPACVRGDAVLVCTYEKLFNAKSTFQRQDVNLVPEAIVLDDAHAGSEIVRKQLTLQLHGEPFIALKEILKSQCKSYHSTKWSDVEAADPQALLEVPHWIWSELCDEIRPALHSYASEDRFRFVWPFLENLLPFCRCVLSGSHAEISPEILPVDQLRAFANASHRLFMSATLADDSLLVRELGVMPSAALTAICPPSDQGLGERMILAPALISPEMDRDYLMTLCQSLSLKHNVVVLTSSEVSGREWEKYGAQFFAGDQVSTAVKRLKDPSSSLKFAVFAQRYDGVDLADDACRILVIDSVPYGESLIDKNDAQLIFSPGGVRNKTVYRIEQGMGRAVRSHADYAVVLLVGQDMATYIGRSEVLAAVTQETRAQIDLSVELAELMKSAGGDAKSAFTQVIQQCLGRDPGWKSFYNSRIRTGTKVVAEPSEKRIQLASAEREAYRLASSNRGMEAIPNIRTALNNSGVEGEELGLYLQRVARIAYAIDPAESMKIQQAARQYCKSTALPPSTPRKPVSVEAVSAAERFCHWIKAFSTLNAAVIEATKISGSLDFNQKFRVVEKSVMELGIALGADSTRPEIDFSIGPDVIWFWGNHLFVIEVKSENQKTLHKGDSGQLHDSIQWAKECYPVFADRITPITVAKVSQADRDAHYPANTRVLLESGCKALAQGLKHACMRLSEQGNLFVTPLNVAAIMTEFKISPDQFLSQHTIPIG
ncbi:hypothetical protein MF6396_00200 [Pseudomonas sp. MF6396]|uniref:DEAD/DEAH box helicase n=1 Tax=Pseudomonas sp. MF6396 TaxID=1960828 RepID=UPI0009962F43|nr:DEAD/DEAH box helicase [Pseudomonas sp. MF6396]OOW07261.1 hypothetical protein MF6396_00200 [Pseudomonas sp. MF6396]